MFSTLYWVIIAIVVLEFVYSMVLDLLNVKASKSPIPDLLSGLYDEQKYRRQQEYFAANTRLGRISSSFGTVLNLGLFAFGVFGWLADLMCVWSSSPIVQTFLFIVITTLVGEVLDLPFGYYGTFVVEEKFGFNKTTRKTFFTDTIKNLVISLVISGVLMCILCWIYTLIPEWFWLVGFTVMTLFGVVFSYFYSELIVPLFNKQEPLPEGELRTAIMEFAKQTGFELKDVYVMDGSKRSTHANAYFTGFGRKKRIVLYDTLISMMTTRETLAVLAHEIGHYKKGHIWKGMLSGALGNLLLMYLLGLTLGSDAIAQAGGASSSSFYFNMMVFGMLLTPISIVTGILSNIISRRNEYEADQFAKDHGLAVELADALKKLSADSLSNLTPHPAVVFTSYSHPTLFERVKHCLGQ